jgi:hypothetical protein
MDCPLSPFGLTHSDLGDHKEQVVKASIFGNKKADALTLALVNKRL